MDEITICRQEWELLFGRLDRLVEQAADMNRGLDELLQDLQAIETADVGR